MSTVPPSPQAWLPPPPPAPPPSSRPVVLAAVIAGVAGLLVGAVIGGAIIFALGSSGAFAPDPLTRGLGGKLARFDLTVGQCANGKVEPGNSFASGAVVPCSGSHDFEVYGSIVPPGAEQGVPYPNPDDLAALAEDHCLLAFAAFVGTDVDGSDLDFSGIIPSRAAWQAGDRAVLCALWQIDGDRLVGSAHGSA